MGANIPQDQLLVPVRMGSEGEISIPKEVQALFGIKPGARLLLLADKKKGIALQRGAL